MDQRLGYKAGSELIFEASGQVHIQRRRRLPLQQLQLAACAARLILGSGDGRSWRYARAGRRVLRSDIRQAQKPQGNRGSHT